MANADEFVANATHSNAVGALKLGAGIDDRESITQVPNAPMNVVKDDEVEETSRRDVSELETTQLDADFLRVKYVPPCFVD